MVAPGGSPREVPAQGKRGYDDPVREVSISEDAIRLGQLLKLAGAVDAGGDVKRLLGTGDVSVNGAPEVRRGRQVRRGDVVGVAGDEIRVV
jgi:ribosome-associated protein